MFWHVFFLKLSFIYIMTFKIERAGGTDLKMVWFSLGMTRIRNKYIRWAAQVEQFSGKVEMICVQRWKNGDYEAARREEKRKTN